MTKEEIKTLTDREFREWLVRLAKENRIKEIAAVCKIRLDKTK